MINTNEHQLRLKLMEFAIENEGVKCMIETGDRTNPNIKKDELYDYIIIYGVEDLKEFRNSRKIEEYFGSLLVLQKKEGMQFLKKFYQNSLRFILVLDDITKLDITFILYKEAQEYLDKDSLGKILLDKEELLEGKEELSEANYRQHKPTQEEFSNCCSNFFVIALNIGKGLYHDKVLYATNIYMDAKKYLDEMTAYYIGCNYNFGVNVGQHYEHFKTYLTEDHYEKYLEIYPQPDRDKLWTNLFQLSMLFRKEALVVAEKLNYNYPKEADRDIIKKLREIWGKYTEV